MRRGSRPKSVVTAALRLGGADPPLAYPAGMSSPQRRRSRRREETSAGGLVVDRSGPEPMAALIARTGRDGRLRWCLPKGHVEIGETFEQTAEREVQEETGIRGRVVDSLGTIDFWFTHETDRIHKTVHHFLLEQIVLHMESQLAYRLPLVHHTVARNLSQEDVT